MYISAIVIETWECLLNGKGVVVFFAFWELMIKSLGQRLGLIIENHAELQGGGVWGENSCT